MPPPTPDPNIDMAVASPVARVPSLTSSAARCLIRPQLTQDGKPDAVSVSFRGPKGCVGSRDDQTHLVHWFPAKMFHRIPVDILESVSPPKGGQVLDPFCGSGTVLVEARARGFHAIGLDINPLSCLISRVKTTPLPHDILLTQLDNIIKLAKSLRRCPDEDVLPSFWFSPHARKALFRLARAIEAVTPESSHRDFFNVSLTSIVRKCSLADPNIPPPVRLSESRLANAGKRYHRAYDRAMSLDTKTIYEMYRVTASSNAHRVANGLADGAPAPEIYNRSALDTKLPKESVDTVITSPPYGGAQKYVRTFKLEMALLGMSSAEIASVDRDTLGTERVACRPQSIQDLSRQHRQLVASVAKHSTKRASMLSTYLIGLKAFAKELQRVLRRDGNAFITLGASRFAQTQLDISQVFSQIALTSGFREVLRLTDRIPSRGMITKRHKSSAVIPSETIVWIQRTE